MAQLRGWFLHARNRPKSRFTTHRRVNVDHCVIQLFRRITLFSGEVSGVSMLNRIFRVAVFAGALSSMLLAQGVTATISGTVTDASGASVAGANITVLNTSKGTTRTAVSGASGEFEVSQLTPADTHT